MRDLFYLNSLPKKGYIIKKNQNIMEVEKLILDVDEHINTIIKEFDFEKVHKVMTFLNWTWAFSTGGAPSIRELKRESRKLLKEAAGLTNVGFVSTGGLLAFRWYDSLQLIFQLEDYDSEVVNHGPHYSKVKLTRERQQKLNKIFKDDQKKEVLNN